MQKTATKNPISEAEFAKHLVEHLARAEEDKREAIQDRLIGVIAAGAAHE